MSMDICFNDVKLIKKVNISGVFSPAVIFLLYMFSVKRALKCSNLYNATIRKEGFKLVALTLNGDSFHILCIVRTYCSQRPK